MISDPGVAPTLTIIVPVFNEAAALPSLLTDLENACRSDGWQVIIINDGSTDNTAELLAAYQDHPGITVIHHKLNRGYGRAIKTGIARATTSYIVTIDGDGQHAVEDIGPMFQYALEKDADMLVGRRSDRYDEDLARRFGKWLIRVFTKVLLPLSIHDLNSGFKLFRADLARKYLTLCPDSMAFSDLITLAFISQRNLVLEKPISIHVRQSGRSKVSIQTAVETVLEITNLVLLFNPLRIFIPLSVLCIVIGITWGAHIVLANRGVSVGAMLAIVTGILFAILGLIASQLSSIRLSLLEGNHRQDGNES